VRFRSGEWLGSWGPYFPDMRLNINLASHPYEDVRDFWLRWGGALAGAGILTLVLLYLVLAGYGSARKDRNLIGQREQQIADRDREREQAQALLNLPQNRSTRDRSQFLNDLFERKAFSWTRVFENLERVMPARMHVLSIHPETDTDNQLELKLVVGGDSHEHALELVRKMEDSPRFRHTYIEKEHFPLPGQAVTDAVQFDITSIYVPESEIPETGVHGTGKHETGVRESKNPGHGGAQ
jgi:type IV pilus assembly protein PilN